METEPIYELSLIPQPQDFSEEVGKIRLEGTKGSREVFIFPNEASRLKYEEETKRITDSTFIVDFPQHDEMEEEIELRLRKIGIIRMEDDKNKNSPFFHIEFVDLDKLEKSEMKNIRSTRIIGFSDNFDDTKK